jgi:hypothetical protein
MTNVIVNAPLEYAAHGLPVFPCKRTDKRPLTKNGFKDATTDPDQIRAWWKQWPDAMIGMPTGKASGIDVVDLDVKKGKNGFAAIPDWADRSPIIVRTPTDPKLHTDGAPDEGGHLWFRSNGEIKGTTDTIALGVDTRGTGGYVIVPPSRNSFGCYRFEKCGLDWIANLRAFPADLAALCSDRPPLMSSNRNNEPLPDCLLQALNNGDVGGQSHDPADLPPVIDLTAIKAMLSVIDPDIDRPEWIAIGCVLYKSLDYDEGFAIWDEWSSNGSKYRARKIKSDWRSIAAGNGYGWDIGTLIYHANEADPHWRSKIAVEEIGIEEPVNGYPYDLGAADDQASEHIERHEQADPDLAETKTKTETKSPKTAASIEPDAGALIISSRKLVANFKPPDYLIEGLLQRRFLYGLTAQTNAGKTSVALRLALHVAIGLPLGDREIEQGKVLFFAGENPDDVTMRWIKLCEETNTDPETDQVFWVSGIYSIKKLRKVIDTQTKKCGPFALVVIDSAAAYFEGEEENSNTQLGAYARMLRTLVEISGGPTILVICHPVKNADPDNLVPRGGSAFVNEIDGNLVLKIVSEAPKVVDLHWQVKFRGPEFSPIPFMIIAGYSKQIKDSKGRQISTVYAKPLSATERAATEGRGQANQDKLLIAMKDHNGASLAELAKYCGWFYKSGDPNKTFTNQTMHDLEARGLVRQDGRHWKLTKAGLAVDTESM